MSCASGSVSCGGGNQSLVMIGMGSLLLLLSLLFLQLLQMQHAIKGEDDEDNLVQIIVVFVVLSSHFLSWSWLKISFGTSVVWFLVCVEFYVVDLCPKTPCIL